MTIYMVRWMDKTTMKNERYACSSMVKAQKKIKELNKVEDCIILPNADEEVISRIKMKSQDEVINLLNTF